MAGESFRYELVSDYPWGAYNWYLGDAHSLIQFNTDVPLNALGLLDICAHEGYPGHHTEAMLKEKHLYQEQGIAEIRDSIAAFTFRHDLRSHCHHRAGNHLPQRQSS